MEAATWIGNLLYQGQMRRLWTELVATGEGQVIRFGQGLKTEISRILIKSNMERERLWRGL